MSQQDKAYDPDLQQFREQGKVDVNKLELLRFLALAGRLSEDGAEQQQVLTSPRANGLRLRVCQGGKDRCGICELCTEETRQTSE